MVMGAGGLGRGVGTAGSLALDRDEQIPGSCLCLWVRCCQNHGLCVFAAWNLGATYRLFDKRKCLNPHLPSCSRQIFGQGDPRPGCSGQLTAQECLIFAVCIAHPAFRPTVHLGGGAGRGAVRAFVIHGESQPALWWGSEACTVMAASPGIVHLALSLGNK